MQAQKYEEEEQQRQQLEKDRVMDIIPVMHGGYQYWIVITGIPPDDYRHAYLLRFKWEIGKDNIRLYTIYDFKEIYIGELTDVILTYLKKYSI